MIRPVYRTQRFVRAAKRYLKKHPAAAAAIAAVVALLEADAFDPRLRTHPLQGQFTGLWACRGGYDLRIVFEFVVVDAAESILLNTIGTHDDVY